jgi:hypothetical protein
LRIDDLVLSSPQVPLSSRALYVVIPAEELALVDLCQQSLQRTVETLGR